MGRGKKEKRSGAGGFDSHRMIGTMSDIRRPKRGFVGWRSQTSCSHRGWRSRHGRGLFSSLIFYCCLSWPDGLRPASSKSSSAAAVVAVVALLVLGGPRRAQVGRPRAETDGLSRRKLDVPGNPP